MNIFMHLIHKKAIILVFQQNFFRHSNFEQFSTIFYSQAIKVVGSGSLNDGNLRSLCPALT